MGNARTESEREQIKLRATYLNGIAIGLFLVGGLSIPTTIFLSSATGGEVQTALAVAAFCFIASPLLHMFAQKSLGGLSG